MIKSFRNRQPHPSSLSKDGTFYSADEDEAKIVAESLREQCSPFPIDEEFEDFHGHLAETVRNAPQNHDFHPSTPQDIKKIINGLRKNKAPGVDAIPNEVLKILPRKHIVALSNIINAMMRH